ncbi:signal transduction histidine kinase, nitrogen specific, NtrB [Candidatus Koribacter versatilis Ellin345]|uniref:histidine kinase n=1 Tax=Koribacter versatilis (strain Ellin345) TaxID=204669 RepID=Q1ITT4_KORVE|nr:PAS domain-containing protein [Candidatus Koribacter versatilis]ABF39716.1 signal transduction histidine kinase, nitrogen specific, NtrB [Candidatus Koribacter versatilis Ellin345]
MENLSIHESLSELYKSADLGLVMADMERVFDANEAALQMFGFTRAEMHEGKLNWLELTPPEYRQLDENALAQLREFGTCVPFEKEFVLRDGTRFPFIIGGVRLTQQPLSWAAYLLSLRENRRIASVEQSARDLKAKTRLINHLAHELNNPLAGLTFVIHLLGTRQDVATDDTKKLLGTASQLVERISATVQHVLVATGNDGV